LKGWRVSATRCTPLSLVGGAPVGPPARGLSTELGLSAEKTPRSTKEPGFHPVVSCYVPGPLFNRKELRFASLFWPAARGSDAPILVLASAQSSDRMCGRFPLCLAFTAASPFHHCESPTGPRAFSISPTTPPSPFQPPLLSLVVSLSSFKLVSCRFSFAQREAFFVLIVIRPFLCFLLTTLLQLAAGYVFLPSSPPNFASVHL